MIYLLSQMLLVTAIAVIVGLAFGWLIHRSMHAGKVHHLQQTVRHQRTQVTQAKSEISMLNDDYDELKLSAQDQINTLQTANQQIPDLLTNLEQSQLLAQQNMKRHESRERSLSAENQQLEEQLAELKNNTPSAKAANSPATKEPVAISQKSRSQGSDNELANDAPRVKPRVRVSNNELVTDAPLIEAHAPVLHEDQPKESPMDMTLASPMNVTAESDSDDQLDGSSLDMTQPPPMFSADELDDDNLFEESSLDMSQATPIFAVPDSDNDPFDQVMEVDDDFHLDFDHTNDTTSQAPLDDTGNTALQNIDTSTLDMLDIGAESEDDELSRVKDALAAERAAHNAGDLNALRPGSQQSVQPQSRFTPSKTADDLQQIFGIGPLTEKALNELGITSYSQLAQLEKHDIQHIADTLEIGPGRIERDNWVGNARSQLEDVLEEL